MGPKSLREIATSVGATVQGERIVFASEFQLELFIAAEKRLAFALLEDRRQKQWDEANQLCEGWVAAYGGKGRSLGDEGHYAEGVALVLLGVNTRQRRSKLPKAERDRIQEQVESLL